MRPTLPHEAARRGAVLLLIAASVTLLVNVALAQEPTDDPLAAARQATVAVIQTFEINGVQAISCVGSGTLISSDGLLLTAAHLAQPIGPCRGERIVIALAVREDEPPVPTYIATPVQVDLRHGLAVLQITSGLDGSVVSADTLNLPFASLGDATSLQAGQQVSLAGFPDFGASPISMESHTLTTVATEPSGSRLAWNRIDRPASGGMSGGGVFDSSGRLIGISGGIANTTGEAPGPACLAIQDTTNDDLIDGRDACVPFPEGVSAFRSVSFALPLIEAARADLQISTQSDDPPAPESSTPEISRVFFSSQVSSLGAPAEIIDSLPSGSSSLFLFFDFRNMRPGTPYALEVKRDGVSSAQLSLGPLAWAGPTEGQWYIGTENAVWLDGNYEFILSIDGVQAASANISVGGSGGANRISNIALAAFVDGSLTGENLSLYPTEITELRVTFDYAAFTDGQRWREVWYLDGSVVSDNNVTWDRGASGRTSVSAVNTTGLPLGLYRMDLFAEDRLVATLDIPLAGSRDVRTGRPVTFNTQRMFSDITRDGRPTGFEGPGFPVGVNSLYVFSNWDFLPLGVPWTYRWFLDGRLIADNTLYWSEGGVGENFWIGLQSDAPLPEGEYVAEIIVAGEPMFSLAASVGSGTQPASGVLAASDQVFITGQVIDSLTGEGIPGALIAVLAERFTSATFLYDESQIISQTISDREGRFSLPRGLDRRAFFTVYVWAEGYITVLEDTFLVLRDQPSPGELTVEMTRP